MDVNWMTIVRWMRRFSAIEMEYYHHNGITAVFNDLPP